MWIRFVLIKFKKKKMTKALFAILFIALMVVSEGMFIFYLYI